MTIQGLSTKQSDFVETYILVSKRRGRKKAQARRDAAIKEFRRFNVNRDAIADRIKQIPDEAARTVLMGQLGKAEALIGDDAKNLDFDAAMARLADVNKAVGDYSRQAEVRAKYALAVQRMDVVENGPPLDNIHDIDFVWKFSESTYQSGIKSNDAGALAAASQAFDQLFGLIDAARVDVTGEGRESKRKLRDVKVGLDALQKKMDDAFSEKHVPPSITALMMDVRDRLKDGETSSLAALPAAADAAELALQTADAAGTKIIADKKTWEARHSRFRERYLVLEAHSLGKEQDYVAPKFKEVTDAYRAASSQALIHDYAKAGTDLTPVFALLEAALRFADDYQNFLAAFEKRKAQVDGLPQAATRTYDEVKDAITAARKLLSDATTFRDGGNMDIALAKLNDIKKDVPAIVRLIGYEDDFEDQHPKLASWIPGFESDADIAALMPVEIALIKKTINESKAKADGGNLGAACQMVENFWGFNKKIKARKALIVTYLDEKETFEKRLAKVKAYKGRIAVDSYYHQMEEDKLRMVAWEAKLDIAMALHAATAYKKEYPSKKKQAKLGEEYVEIKDENDQEIARLEGGAPGGDAARESIALCRAMMNDAVGLAQKDDWFQAVRLMNSAKEVLGNGTRIAGNVKIVEDAVDDGKIANVGADFDGAYGEFTKVHIMVGNFDKEKMFADRLQAAKTKADGARALATGAAADPAQARATLEEAIKDCKDVMVSVNDAGDYAVMQESMKNLLGQLKKSNKKKCVQPEVDAAAQFIASAQALAKAPALDFKGAQSELAKAAKQIREGFGVTPYYKYYSTSVTGLEKSLKKLNKKKFQPAMNKESQRLGDLIAGIKQAFTERRMKVMSDRIKEAEQLKASYAQRLEDYGYAVREYDKVITKGLGDEMNSPGTTELAKTIRDEIDAIDKAMADHLYDTAFYMIRNVSYKIGSCRKQAEAYESWLPVKSAADKALGDIRDRDEPENGPGHDRLVELQAIFDSATEQENLLNYSGAAKRLAGYVELCKSAEPLFDTFDLYIAARDEAASAADEIRGIGTVPIAPLWNRIESKRDNALRLAAAFDFPTATTLLRELLADCATARNVLDSQAAFGLVVDQLKDVEDGDADDLKMSISAARATHKQISARPSALFVKDPLKAAGDRIDSAEAEADQDFDKARRLLNEALDACNTLAGEMGRFEQFTDTVALALGLLEDLNKHQQAGYAQDEISAQIRQVNAGMATVRGDPTLRTRVRDETEDAITRARELANVLDAQQAWHVAHQAVAKEFDALEKHENRHQIGDELTAIRTCLDESAAKSVARDHKEAHKQLDTARDHITQAHVGLRVANNEAPSKEELKKLMDAPNGHELLDKVINQLDADAQRKVMNTAFEVRFGCRLDLFASPKTEKKGRQDKDLGKKAPNIKRFYELMSALPESSTLDNDSMLIFSHAGTTPDGSYYRSDNKEVAMREGEVGDSSIYAYGLEQELGKSRDQLHLEEGEPMSMFSWNTLHEVGHAVDDKLGFMNKKGQALAGWEVFGGNFRPVAAAIAADLSFDADYIAEYIAGGQGSRPPIPEPAGCDPEEWERRRKEACIWIDRVRVGQKPWSSDSIAKQATTKAGKVFHESYENDWSCYDYSARGAGVSGYQFRAPGEWFSELYAAVHSKKLKNSHTHYDTIKNAK